ncbi:MAG: hypothetical protein ACIAQU_08515, partial [Phycisphaerales bacterium JB064]
MPNHTLGQSRRGNAPKRILLAVAIAAVGVGVLVYIFASGQGGPRQGSQGQGLPPVGEQQGIQLGGPGGEQQVARNVDISFVDRNDPSRTQARMIAQQMAPQGSRGYIATTPSMWIYQTSGQTIHVKANQGDLAMPARSQPPERGTLTGDVLIRVYEAGADTSPQAIDPTSPTTTPAATFSTPALDFNVELGTISTQETVKGSAENLVFEVNGLDIRGNQVTSQLERLESFRGGTATFSPPAPAPREPQPQAPAQQRQTPPAAERPQGQQATPQPAAQPQQAPAPTPIETFYHLQLQENVEITRGSMTTTADTLEAWVRLV